MLYNIICYSTINLFSLCESLNYSSIFINQLGPHIWKLDIDLFTALEALEFAQVLAAIVIKNPDAITSIEYAQTEE